ncbi:hypothetical protein B0T24DRAFT_620441 [Lasiosphaeria ovina]|uniref:Uncharacterized protein n=1 Tax=Lasiosphaeria ovina TaxID=92902 RepID=A0AAE0KJ16_9PEZI|nr:hypothetical protein B0T24DRAFT_620441 [Lasiosphaeria ovina]
MQNPLEGAPPAAEPHRRPGKCRRLGRYGGVGAVQGSQSGVLQAPRTSLAAATLFFFSTVLSAVGGSPVAIGGRRPQLHSVPRNSTRPKPARGMGKDGGSRRRIRAAALATSDGPVSPLDRLWPRACRSSTLSAGLFHPGAWNWAAGVGDKV